MAISARTTLQGKIENIAYGQVSAEVSLDANGTELVAAITKGSAERPNLSEAITVTGVVKAANVMIATA